MNASPTGWEFAFFWWCHPDSDSYKQTGKRGCNKETRDLGSTGDDIAYFSWIWFLAKRILIVQGVLFICPPPLKITSSKK